MTGVRTREQDLATAVTLLQQARSVLLMAHNHPDADSLGSAVALGLALKRGGATVSVTFDRPATVPASLAGLPGMDMVTPADDWLAGATADLDLIVTLDAGSAERLGRLAALFAGQAPVLVIDHHVSNTFFGDHHLVDPDVDATVVLVHELLHRMDVPLDVDLASLLYAGLATDTGGFRHGTAAGHRLAGQLMEAGVLPTELMREITDTHPFRWMGLLSAVLGRAKLDPSAAGGRGLVHTSVTLQDARGLRQEESDAVIDILRTSAEACAAAVAKQSADDEWQVSLRSRGDVRVGDAAIALGGGGHPHAAGFRWHGDYPGAIEALTAALAPHPN